MIIMAVLTGLCSGLAALALHGALLFMHAQFEPWQDQAWAFLLPGVGAAAAAVFLQSIVREAPGHGVPDVIHSVSRYGGWLRRRSMFSRLVASCLTIGSGGSAGPEAPVVVSGSAIGSNIARLFKLRDRQRTTLVGCGAAGAIGAIFNAPITGMVFAVEVILGEWKALNIVPIAIAAVSGTEISRRLMGNQLVFRAADFPIHGNDILAAVALAGVAAAVALLLTYMLRASSAVAGRVHLPLPLKAAAGGMMVGLITIYFPVVAGEGYHFVQLMLSDTLSGGLLLLLLMALAKIVATSLTLGWGGAGGIFAPSLVVGGLTGLAFHRFLLWLWPTVTWTHAGCYVLLGMAGLIAGMLQAPLTAIFLVVEVSGGYSVIVPLVIVAVLSSSLCQIIEPASFYTRELVARGLLLRPGTDARVIADLTVPELLETDCQIVTSDMRLKDFMTVITRSQRNFFPVTDPESGHYLGMVHLDDVRPYLFDTIMHEAVILEQIMNPHVPTVSPHDDLNHVLQQMDAQRLFSMPVIDNNRFLGMISKGTLLDQYRKELIMQTTE